MTSETKRLPSHITEDDVRLISGIVAPVVMTEAWNAAIDAALSQVDIADSGEATVPSVVFTRIELLKRPTS